MMNCNISIKTTFLFLSFSFLTTVLPMDLSVARVQNFSFPSDNEHDRKIALLGDFFGQWPNDILLCAFAPRCDPEFKNNFRNTNLAFSYIFSWEDAKPFMLCKELCASERDIKSLIIQTLCKENKTKRDFDFINSMSDKLGEENCKYTTQGRSEIILWKKNPSEQKPDKLSLFIDEKGNGELSDDINPFIIPCIARSPKKMKTFFNEYSFVFDEGVLAAYILVENNDAQTLNSFLKGLDSIKKENILELAQFALFCASNKVAELLATYFQEYPISLGLIHDHLSQWFDGIKRIRQLRWVKQEYIDRLREKHAKHPDRFNECYDFIFKK